MCFDTEHVLGASASGSLVWCHLFYNFCLFQLAMIASYLFTVVMFVRVKVVHQQQ